MLSADLPTVPPLRSRLASSLPPWSPPFLVFTVALAWLAWLAVNRLVFTLDEGIYLEGAARLLRNQVPYRDFFTLTGPASFWLYGTLFRFAGATLPSARLALVFDLALMAVAVCSIARRRAKASGAALAAFCFIAFSTADPAAMTVNHRWDGCAAAMCAVLFALRLLDVDRSEAQRSGDAVFAGAAAALAAWFTPSLLLLAAAIGAFLVVRRELRRGAVWFLAGGAAVSGACVGWLVWQGAWVAFLRHMAWSASNYAGANRVHYGAVNGGYAALFADCPASEFPLRALVVLCLALPAILPAAATAGLIWRILRHRETSPHKEVLLLLLCQSAMVAATYPRWDLSHLLQVSAVPYALSAWVLAGVRKPAAARILGGAACCFAAVFLAAAFLGHLDLVRVRTRAGDLLAARSDLETLRVIERNTRPGEPIFVYPYMPLIYVLSGGHNPTPYSFLQPGMMTAADERAALAALERDMPARIIYSKIPPKSYLWLFPSSDPSRLRMAALETFIAQRYECVDSVRNAGTTYRILAPRPGPYGRF